MSERFMVAVGVLLLSGICGCFSSDRAESDPAAGSTVSSTAGSTVSSAESPSLRMISLSPNITETIFAIGAEAGLVAVTDRCDVPPAARQKPCVGEYGRPNVERVLAFRPTHLLTIERLPADMRQMLENAGIQVVLLRIGNLESMYTMFREVGRLTGRVAEAEQLVQNVQNDFVEARQQIASKFDVPPRLFFELWNDPLTTIGRESYLNDLVTAIGAVNVAAELQPAYPNVSPEKVSEWNPDFILLVYMAALDRTDAESPVVLVSKRIGWRDLRAVRRRHVLDGLPTDILLRPGPRLGKGARAIAERL